MKSNRLAGKRVQLHRVRLGLSPEQYGIRIGVSGMTVRRVEKGYQPFRSTQAKFCKDMGVQVDELWPLSLDRRVDHRVAA
jgi:DNA-binding XRE family transcriptional regulator